MIRRCFKLIGNYFYRVGVLAHYLILFAFLSSIFIGGYYFARHDLPADIFFKRAADSLASSQSPLLSWFSRPALYISNFAASVGSNKHVFIEIDPSSIGANKEHSFVASPKVVSDQRLIKHYQILQSERYTREVYVNTSKELLAAIKAAQPGDDIVIEKGDYYIKSSRIYVTQSGSQHRPIRLRADAYGDVSLELQTFEGFLISGNYWSFENLKINGVCQSHQACEHAFHIAGAKNIIVRNNEIKNFNSIIKANGSGSLEKRRYPDNILVESNTIYNEQGRETSSSVTLIDVVAGNDWIVRRNFIANNSKQKGDRISYAAFLKGNGRDGLLEENIVNCEWTLPDDETTRVGLSLGGGGTGETFCRGGRCDAEHHDGVVRNNLIVNCSRDVGLYLNRANNSVVTHNTLLNTLGIDVRFPETSAFVSNNLLNGSLRSRNGSTLREADNRTQIDVSELEDIRTVNSSVLLNLCGQPRGKFSAQGAADLSCFSKVGVVVGSHE